MRPVVAGDGSAHHHHQDNVHGHCESCGHAHAPSPQVIAAASSAPELASVILAIAIRPCSGAILLLVLTWKMASLRPGLPVLLPWRRARPALPCLLHSWDASCAAAYCQSLLNPESRMSSEPHSRLQPV
ncbi:hypothetical protein IB235_24325 [Paracoccus sp. PAR01]|nr:hypothetical protein [Paracoccus sp. PAR01]